MQRMCDPTFRRLLNNAIERSRERGFKPAPEPPVQLAPHKPRVFASELVKPVNALSIVERRVFGSGTKTANVDGEPVCGQS